MSRIIIFAGTKEGRILADLCENKGIAALICVATEYGEELLNKYEKIKISEGRKDFNAMLKLFEAEEAKIIYDATHPYALEVSENIKKACKEQNIKYIRVLRESSGLDLREGYEEFKDIEEVVAYLKDKEGSVLISTGSKELHKYAVLDKNMLYARVLPSIDGINACKNIGLESSHIIAMQGPFNLEMNIATLKQYGCKYLVTKESGKTGGFEEKIEACRSLGVKALVIGRQVKECGISLKEACDSLTEMSENKDKYIDFSTVKFDIAGIGPGNPAYLSINTVNLIREADFIIGMERMKPLIRMYAEKNPKIFISHRNTDILAYMEENIFNYAKVLVLVSGDNGFFSLGNKLLSCMEERIKEGKYVGLKAKLHPGISSFSYMASLCFLTWEDMSCYSVHGKDENCSGLISEIRHKKKVFCITSGKEQVNEILRKVCQAGFTNLKVYIGENLSYENERILSGKAEDFINHKFDTLSSLIFVNEDSESEEAYFGIADEEFIRDKVPMTKADIRAIAMARLGLCKTSICYDVGAGSGSCSIEMARYASAGKVYAIEKKEVACELIKKNIEKFGLNNIDLIKGEACEVIPGLEPPTHVFIGGSSGSLAEIVDKIYEKNKYAKTVISAISLETFAEINEIGKAYEKKGYKVSLSLISFADNKRVANYNMLIGGNPVLLANIRHTSDKV